MTSKRLTVVPVALIALGLGLSLYLLLRTYALLYGDAVAGTDACSALFEKSCDQTLQNDSSWLLGIPVAGWGVVYFGSLLALMLLGWLIDELFRPQAFAGALAANIAGLLFSTYLIFLIVTKRAEMCPACLAVHTVNLLLLPALLIGAGESPRALFARIQAGFATLFDGGPSGKNPNRTWSAVAFFACIMVGAVLYGSLFSVTQYRAAHSGDVSVLMQSIEGMQSRARVRVPVRPDDPRIGLPQAPLQLVMFSDFECSFCQSIQPAIQRLREAFPEDLSLVFKHFPLNPDCNPLVTKEGHPGACRAAHIAEAARMQGRFWPVHDALYEAKVAPAPDRLEAWAGTVGVDRQLFLEDVNSPAVDARVREDIQAGIDLGVRGTPTFFINGRRIKDFRLLEDEVYAEWYVIKQASRKKK